MTLPGRLTAVVASYAAIFVAGVGSVAFAPVGSDVASWWPAAGISVALLVLSPRRWCLGLAVGVALVSGLANVAGGRDPVVSACFGVANAAEAMTACWVLRGRSGRTPRLTRLEDIGRLFLAAAAGAAVLALGAALTVGLLTSGSALDTVPATFPSHAAATMVIVPVALLWRFGKRRAAVADYAVQATALAAVTALVFLPHAQTQLAFLTLPLLAWGALRLDALTVSIEVLLVSVCAVTMTSAGRGPFHAAVLADQLSPRAGGALLQAYLLVAVILALPLAIEVEERRRLMAAVSASESLFRRNFTSAMTGMLLLTRHGNRLEIVEANETAHDLLSTDGSTLVSRMLDRLLTPPAQLRAATTALASGEVDGWRGQLGVADRPDTLVDLAISRLTPGDGDAYSAQLLDVTELHRARASAEASERLTGATLDTTASIIILTDLEGTVLRCNTATLALSGFTEEQLVGRPVWERLVPPRRVGLAKAMFGPEGRAGFPWTGDGPLSTADGETLQVIWSTALVRDDDGRPTHAVMTGLDVTTERVTSGQIRLLLEAGISTAIIGVDAEGTITLANAGAEAMLGRPADDLCGTPFTELLDPKQLHARTRGLGPGSGWAALTATLANGGESQMADWDWVGADGEHHIVSMTISGSDGTHAPHAGYLVVGRDVTEQRESQLMLISALEKEKQAVERLRALDVAKNDFVSTVSHELRTPVTSVVGYTEMLQEADPDPLQAKLLAAIARNGERLIALCDDLLTLGSLDSGAALWETGTVDLATVLHGVEESIRPVTRHRELDLTYYYPDEPILVSGDKSQLERVMANLLGNAVKFTRDGGRVETRLERRGGEAWLVVTDTGIGIPEAEQEQLFEKFFRSSTSQHLAIQGSGLGLSIVAGIVTAHGGRIGVRSAEGEGTTFAVRLPLKVA